MTAAAIKTMCSHLRPVTFTLGNAEYIPDATPQENTDMEERVKLRTGYFHRWVDDVDTSKDIPYVKTMALVEDSDDGSVYMVEYHDLTFVDR